jgi:hypothetical protein
MIPVTLTICDPATYGNGSHRKYTISINNEPQSRHVLRYRAVCHSCGGHYTFNNLYVLTWLWSHTAICIEMKRLANQ